MTFLKYIGKNVYKMKKFTGGKRTFGSLYLLKQTMLNDKKYDYYHLVTGSDFFFVSPNRFDEILVWGIKRSVKIE